MSDVTVIRGDGIGETYVRDASGTATASIVVDSVVRQVFPDVKETKEHVLASLRVELAGLSIVDAQQISSTSPSAEVEYGTFRAVLPIGTVEGELTGRVLTAGYDRFEDLQTGQVTTQDWSETDSFVVRVSVDSTAPALSVASRDPQLTPEARQVVNLNVQEAGAGLASLTWEVPGGPAQPFPIQAPWAAAVDWRQATGQARTVVCPATIDVTVRARDAARPLGNEGVLSLQLTDEVAPQVQIDVPAQDFVFPNDGSGATIQISGSARDHWSGVTGVQYRLDGGSWSDLRPSDAVSVTQTGFSFSLRLSDFGEHRVEVRAQDAAGNVLDPPQVVRFEVAAEVTVEARPDVLGLGAYLADLVDFAGRSITVPRNATAVVSEAEARQHVAVEVARLFHQPILRVAGPTAAGSSRPQSEVRSVIQVLRQVLDTERRDLVGHWSFADGAGPNAVDGSGNAFTARTVVGAPAWAAGRSGRSCISLSGDAELAVDLPGGLVMRDALTLMAWVRADGPGSGDAAVILGKEGEYLLARRPNGEIVVSVAMEDPGWGWISTGVLLPLGQWVHVAVSYDSSRILVYRDGELAFQRNATGLIGSVEPDIQDLRIGGRQAFTARYDGLLSDVRIYAAAVPPAVVARVAGKVPVPLGIWSLRRGSGSLSLDEVGSRVMALDGASWLQGRNGTALSVAPGQRAIVADADGFRPGQGGRDFTVTAWLRLDGPRGQGLSSIVHQGTDGERTFEVFLAPSADALGIRVRTGPGTTEGPAGLIQVDPRQWVHVTYRKEGDVLSLSIDGRERLRHRLSSPVASAPGPLIVGSGGDGLGFQGLVEDLRVYDNALTAVEIAELSAATDRGRKAYREVAYRALLNFNGVSFDELRLSRNQSGAQRERLAARMGVLLRPGRPDQLDDLLRQDAQLTEGYLEEMFGLADTSRDPLAPDTEPRLVSWRREALRVAWQNQDAATVHAPPLLEPAIIGEVDLVDPGGLGPRLAARQQELDARRTLLHDAREQAASPVDGVDAAVLAGVGVSTANLQGLLTRRQNGENITAGLAAVGLAAGDLDRLLLIRQLASDATATGPELEELEGLLVDAFRRQRWAAWRAEELTLLGGRPLTLSPDHFHLRERAIDAVPEAFLDARLDWEDRLRARNDQDAAIQMANVSTVADAEAVCLPVLRAALIPPATRVLGLLDGPDPLSERLLLDVAASGRTSVAGRAVNLMIALLLGVRTRRFDDAHPASTWSAPDPEGFDADMLWMGAHDAWQAAMSAFFNPESILHPALRPLTASSAAPIRTEAFDALLAALRSREGTPATRVTAALAAYQEKRPKGVAGLNDDYVPNPSRQKEHRDVDAGFFQNSVSPAIPPPLVGEVLYFVPLMIALQLHRWGAYTQALDWFRLVWDDTAPVGQRAIYGGLRLEKNTPPVFSRGKEWLRELNPHVLAGFHGGNPYTRFTLISLARLMGDFADSEFTRDTPEARARASVLYLAERDVLASPELAEPSGVGERGLPTNPALTALRLRVDNQLRKLRDDRNIAGMKRAVEASEATAPAQIVIGASGALQAPPAIRLRPTGYRYTTLVERARRLVALAAQIEASYLAALERKDAATYQELEAGHHLELAGRGAELQRLRVSEAAASTEISRRRQHRSVLLQSTYDSWIDDGPSAYETSALTWTTVGATARAAAIGFQAAAQIAHGYTTAAAATWGAVAANTAAALNAAMVSGGATASVAATAAETASQVNGMRASWERREQEWKLQRALAAQDFLVGEQEVVVAEGQEKIVATEAATAEIAQGQASTVATYLSKRFLNSELYEWMTGVLGDVYAYFLQQATATALLAQQQLTFERQLAAAQFVKDDYWRPEPEAGAGAPADRRGLTGSARLMRDLEELDQYAFESDRRKLNLTHTFSLAALAPLELQRFRETGVLDFATPMEAFDRAFPGHYLRLIKRVRTSVIALVPPVQGIRATLTASGVSRVVVGGDSYQEVVIRRDPELVALTSPSGATGVFELDTQAEMLYPFESMGVATRFQFQMPKASNAIDFDSVADIYLTIDYTALSDPDYRVQVIAGFDRRYTADRSFSLRSDFPDQWYELNNPDTTQLPYTVALDIRAADFPPNLEALAVAHVVLYIVGPDGPVPAVDINYLRLSPADAPAGAPTTGGAATAGPDGIVSTRRSNGSAWLALIGTSPVGRWDLSFAGTIAPLIASGAIEDVLLVVSFSGVTPPWPPG